MTSSSIFHPKVSILLLLILFCFPVQITRAAEQWRGPAHVAISTVGSFVLAEIPTLFTDEYQTHNLYFFSGTIMLVAGFGKEVYDEIVPGKKFTWEDIGLDILGITVGITSHYLLRERKKKKVKT